MNDPIREKKCPMSSRNENKIKVFGLRNSLRETQSAKNNVKSPIQVRPPYVNDKNFQYVVSNVTFCEGNSRRVSPKRKESLRQRKLKNIAFNNVNQDSSSDDSDEADNISVEPQSPKSEEDLCPSKFKTIGFNNVNQDSSSDDSDEADNILVKQQSLKSQEFSSPSKFNNIGFNNVNQISGSDDSDGAENISVQPKPLRLQAPIDLPRRTCKGSPCKTKPPMNCKRSTSISSNRHSEKHSDKLKVMQQCFEQLDSNDWDVTLKGLKTLSQIAKNEPEQLDSCAPGLLARMLGKHVKNLRSQVARVACSATSEVFRAHIRGIDQDLDEIAGSLLHRTADTNRFLRDDCNAALDNMVEHFPPHRTIITIANRGASHQNTIVHATTARLLLQTVNKIGPEHVMILPRDCKDKLFATTAKLLTDGNLQARKYAKETFRLLSRCEGFRKALTDAVSDNTLRLIDKTLRSL